MARKPARGPRAREPFSIGGVAVAPGTRRRIELDVAHPYGQAQVSLPVVVVHGRHAGPRLFVCAAIHGDEIIGVEILRRLLQMPALKAMAGTLIAAPIVNVYGFLTGSRYLPDRRDLNRSFPGSPTGSLGARLAHVFMREIVRKSTHGVDLHTAANHRENLPHIRGLLDDQPTAGLARAFGAPVILNAGLLEGSLRQAVVDLQIPIIVYEAGEAHRFDEVSIRVGVRGVINVMRHLGMLRRRVRRRAVVRPVLARSSQWVRAPESGVLRTAVPLGARVRRGSTLGIIAEPVGDDEVAVTAPFGGIVIGRTGLPLVNEGDGLFHIARFHRPGAAAAAIEAVQDELDPLTGLSPSGEPPIQ